MKQVFSVRAIDGWKPVAKMIASLLRPGTILTLSGPLGAGKTTFVQTLALTLGIQEIPKSPTFSLVRTYPIRSKHSTIKTLVHVDAYRIERPEDVRSLGLDDLIHTPGSVMVIEWPENLERWLSALSNQRIVLTILMRTDGRSAVVLS